MMLGRILIIRLILVLAVSLSSFHTAAQETQTLSLSLEETLGLVEGVYITIDDQVNDRCWTNADLVKNKMALVFEQSDISVKDEPNFSITHSFPAIEIHGIGFREENGRCVGYIRTSVIVTRTMNYGSDKVGLKVDVDNALASIFRRSAIYTSGDSLNGQIEENIESFSAEFAAKVLGNRRSEKIKKIKETLPGISEYISRSEFNSYVDQLFEQSRQNQD
jgi:hypothetical protein